MADQEKKNPEAGSKNEEPGAEQGGVSEEQKRMIMMRRLQMLRKAAADGKLSHAVSKKLEGATDNDASVVLASIDPGFQSRMESATQSASMEEAVEMPLPLKESGANESGSEGSESGLPGPLQESGPAGASGASGQSASMANEQSTEGSKSQEGAAN